MNSTTIALRMPFANLRIYRFANLPSPHLLIPPLHYIPLLLILRNAGF